MRKRYPKPDFKVFFRGAAWVWGCVIFLHCIPDLAAWFYAHFYGETFVINERRYRVLLVIAYVMAAFPTLLWIVGACYATWQNRKLEREEKSQN